MAYRDNYGNTFNTPDGKPPASAGVAVTIQTPAGPQPATWVGGQAVANKK